MNVERNRNMNLLYDIWSVLTPRQRRWMVWAQALSILMACSTVTGIASIAPFFAVLGHPQLIDQPGPLHSLYIYLGFSSKHSFEVGLGLGFLAVVLVANLINIMGSFAMIRLSYRISTDLQTTLFQEYLRRPYAFHAK